MRSWSLLPTLFLSLGSLHRLTGVQATDAAKKQPSFLQQSFFFDWPTTGVPSQIVEQCDTLAISWSRGSATGPNPVAPYLLQIYTSAFVVPLVIDAGSGSSFDFPVPFNPGTQFQICMFDKMGNPGGCQRPMSVYPSLQSSNPTCRNLTYPQPNQVLDIAGTDWTGSTLSQFGWPPQCKDISLQPKNGTPPYTLTVAPSLHPPWNITSDNQNPINWTVALSWGSMFYISVADSAGNIWANGPMHAGGDGPTGCLATDAATPTDNGKDNQVSTYVAVGSGIGGLVAGLIIGLVGALAVLRCFKKNRQGGLLRQDSFESAPSLGAIAPYTTVPHTPYHDRTETTAQTLHGVGSLGRLRTDGSYKVEPFVLPQQQQQPPTSPSAAGRESLGTAPTSDGSTTDPMSPDQRKGRPNVYVVHHDGGRAPVTVYTDDGAEVVELPPMYNQESQGASSSSRPVLQPQRRTPGAVRKSDARSETMESPAVG
jgi:hypothetical protein